MGFMFDNGYDEGIKDTKADVKNWHPKCQTCDHYMTDLSDRALGGRVSWCEHLDFEFTDPRSLIDPSRHGCLAHTALRGEEG